jgi:hypothetical protein
MPIRGWSCGGYSFRKYPFAVAVVLGSVCALPAQAQQAPQTEDSVTISVGIKERVFSHARDFAAHYLNYSLHSSNAYENFHESSFDEARQTYTQVTDTEAQFGPEHNARARGIIGRWKLIFGRKGPLQCLDNSVPCFTRGIPIPGLSVLAYKRHSRRDSDVCREIVIAFRGTDARQISDWVSNFRIFTRLLPIDDEYDQVRRNIDHIVRTLTRDRCYREGRTRIIAVGHSLGGGLAQLAGYANNKIRTVYAFNS